MKWYQRRRSSEEGGNRDEVSVTDCGYVKDAQEGEEKRGIRDIGERCG